MHSCSDIRINAPTIGANFPARFIFGLHVVRMDRCITSPMWDDKALVLCDSGC